MHSRILDIRVPRGLLKKKVAGGTYIRARLDRALATAEWINSFQHVDVEHVTTACSDHSAILIKTDEVQNTRPTPKMFRYEAMWESHDAFCKVLADAWQCAPHVNSVDGIKDLLLALSGGLGRWERVSQCRKEN